MKVFYGAAYDLEAILEKCIFIVSPNNSGSTFLKDALATSSHTWNLAQEGQHTFGFAGPVTRATGYHLIWAAKQQWIDLFADESKYDWGKTRKAWFFQAYSKTPKATLFVEKSPPSVLRVADLNNNFINAKFIFIVRNPYAVIEGICRRYKNKSRREILELSAIHVINCFYYQKNNIQKNTDHGVFFTYEEMCEDAKSVQKKIQSIIPELDDLHLQQKIPIKGMYNEVLRNMNNQQIERLTEDDIDHINQTLTQHEGILKYFGYKILKNKK